MNEEQTVLLLITLNSYYGKKFEYPTGRDKLDTAKEKTWYKFLKDYPFQAVETATERLMVKKEWCPTPGEIIQEIEKIKEGKEGTLTAEEAWYKVKEAISDIGYTYHPQKVKEAIPEKALRAAQVIGLGLIAREGGENSYIMNSYIKAYNNLEEKRKEQQRLPQSLKEDTEKLTKKFKGTPQIEGEVRENESND